MTITFRHLIDKQFSPAQVTKILIERINNNGDIGEILETLRSQKTLQDIENTKFLIHPLADLEKKSSEGPFAYFEKNNRLNNLIAKYGTLLQQIDYLSLMGVTPAIERCVDFKAALTFHKFSEELARLGIVNPSFTAAPGTIRRIHAVHSIFLNDEEISAGLSIAYQKNTCDNQVIYVCNPETLNLALEFCAPDSKLTVDGHWEHAKRSVHGVWEASDSAEIACNLSDLLKNNPGKINSINLLGCQAGSLVDARELENVIYADSLLFKDEQDSSFKAKEMALFRNRTVYRSIKGEFPFAKDSLAGQVILHINNPCISVTASPSYTYPFLFNGKASFNISSDSKKWKGTHRWEETTTPFLFQKLHQSKITYVNKAPFLLWANNSSHLNSAEEESFASVSSPASGVTDSL
jgi:hypothetical protein